MHKKKAFQKLFLFFRDRLAKHEIATTNELEAIFSNINDLIELTLTLIGSLEDNLEMKINREPSKTQYSKVKVPLGFCCLFVDNRNSFVPH